MPREMYCWRCKCDMPMLTEAEWAIIEPALTDAVKDVKRYRWLLGASLSEAFLAQRRPRALALYEELTGFKETNINAVWHHRVSLYGPDCVQCGKPLRTHQANWCAYCGAERR